MWILEGPFDVDPEESEETKHKLLKPGDSLALGRKNKPLLINSKKISSEHCVFSVEKFLPEDVVNIDQRPSLRVFNSKDKALKISRGEKTLSLNSKATQELRDGDQLHLNATMQIIIFWRNSCYISRPSPTTIEACAKIGMSIAQTFHPSADHYITPSYSITPTSGASLLSRTNFVKQEWLAKMIEACTDSQDGVYEPPSLTKYRPSFSPSLPSQFKKYGVWEPKEERRDLFEAFRFLCSSEKDNEIDITLREFITAGSGAIDVFPISDSNKFRAALKRAQAKEKEKERVVVVVGEQAGIVAAVGEGGWKELEQAARAYQKRFFSIADLVHAVLDVDTSPFKTVIDFESQDDEEMHPSSPLPDCVPNSMPEEMTVPPAIEERPRLRRRAPSRQPSEQPTPSDPLARDESSQPPSPPRRKLTRRVRDGVPFVTGLGDSSMVIDAAVAAAAPTMHTEEIATSTQPMILDLTAPVAARSTRLKRRRPGEVTQSISSLDTSEPAEEPSYKKFKALFDATNDPEQADALMSQLPDNNLPVSQSQTQSRSGDTNNRKTGARQTLDTVPEDTQESQSMAIPSLLPSKKRKATSDDEEMAGVEAALAPSTSKSVAPPTKKKAIEKVNAVEPTSQKPPSAPKKSSSGAAPGKPDTDPVFLKAVASTKRGKKAEDAFDREFNKLKISKPELDRNDENLDNQYAALDDFREDRDIRGNFMVIVEFDVYKESSLEKRTVAPNPEWAGLPNFKKFKKASKDIRPRTKKIELIASENPDYSLGPGKCAWEGDLTAQTQNVPLDDDMNQDSTQGTRPARSQKRPLLADDDSDIEFAATKPLKKVTKAAASKKATSSRATKSSAKSQPLFIDDDDDDDDDDETQSNRHDFSDVEEQDSLDQTLPSTAPTRRAPRRAATTAKSKKVIVVEDDSDEDAFKGLKARRRR
ncbi:hypothetical protein BDP27DRAFT_1418030 [Rhodocollybia butyracea]|uniref:Nibrin n=1 Tax=Rhodocollybia butyracea TaxID=206335 RepID=A0A9P5Q082_9AGAR|nr:hypothetical protein BDP27DRAFT_1418030 [Rhodocollybia butyracea]